MITFDGSIPTSPKAWSLRFCSNCNSQNVSVSGHKRCTRCKCVAYCNANCQKEHWKKTHQRHCSEIVQSLENIKIRYEKIAECLPEYSAIPQFVKCVFSNVDAFEDGDRILSYMFTRLHHISILDKIEAPSELIVEHFTDVYTLLGGASVPSECWHTHMDDTHMDDKTSETIFLHHLDQVGDDSLIYRFNKYFLHRGYNCARTPYTPLIPLVGGIAESTEALDLTHVQFHSTSALNVYQMKFDLYNSTKVLKIVEKLLNIDCTSLISDFLGVKASSSS